jgi:hypothetical protein
MTEQDAGKSGKSPQQRPKRNDEKAESDEFRRFCADKALTDTEKAALPANLRRLLGWE